MAGDASSLDWLDLYIGGRAVDARRGRRFTTVDPTRGEPWATVADAERDDVDDGVRDAHKAFASEAWRWLTASRRGRE